MTADKEFEKFREKKLNERAAEKTEGDAMFFGSFKKKEEPEDGPKKIKLSDLAIPGQDDRPDNVPKVGESLKLIDIALGNAPGGPARPAGKGAPPRPGSRPGAPQPPRPGQPRPTGAQAPQGQRPPTVARPSQPAPGRPGQPAPGQGRPTARPGAPQSGAPRPGQQTLRPGAPGQKPAGGPATGPQKRPTNRPLIPPGGPPPSRPAPPPPGFSDRANTAASERLEKADHFEDTTFVEATEHRDPYEFQDEGSTGDDFADDARLESGRPGSAPRRADPSKTSSGRHKRPKPPGSGPDPGKTSSRRMKRGPSGR